MKTLALTIAASLIASTSAFANGGVLFDVNQAPHNYDHQGVQLVDIEATASIGAVPSFEIKSGRALSQKDQNPALFDVDD